jgi:lantibiotic modifying enzyme
MLRYICEGNYDYLHGALGIGKYFLSRKSSLKSHEYLIDLVNELEKQGIKIRNGIAWKSKLLPESEVWEYNLSMSHGIASIITFLSHLYKIEICSNKVLNLVTGAVNFLLQSKQDTTKFKYQYPGIIGYHESNSEDRVGGRLAWCYNDLGISIALWQAGQIFNNEIWIQEGINLLLHTTTIIESIETGVVDVGLCHGAAGIAHIYNRMYNFTKIETLNDAAIFWIDKSLKMATFEDGLAGYKTHHIPQHGGWQNDYGFLEGIAGIGLAMMSFASNIDPNWDSALLIS